MAELMEVIKDRQVKSGVSVERYANQMGLTGGALYNYLNGNRKSINMDAARKMSQFYFIKGDTEAVSAIVSYITGLDNIRVTTSN